MILNLQKNRDYLEHLWENVFVYNPHCVAKGASPSKNGIYKKKKKGKRKVQGVQQSQAAGHPRHQEEEETDKTKQAQIENKRPKSHNKS